MSSLFELGAHGALAITSMLGPVQGNQPEVCKVGREVEAVRIDGEAVQRYADTKEPCIGGNLPGDTTTTTVATTTTESNVVEQTDPEAESGQGITAEEAWAIGLIGLAGVTLTLALVNGERVRRRGMTRFESRVDGTSAHIEQLGHPVNITTPPGESTRISDRELAQEITGEYANKYASRCVRGLMECAVGVQITVLGESMQSSPTIETHKVVCVEGCRSSDLPKVDPAEHPERAS